MVMIQREQDRYEGIKEDLQQDLADVKRTAKKLEDVSSLALNFLYLREAKFLNFVLKFFRYYIYKLNFHQWRKFPKWLNFLKLGPRTCFLRIIFS